MVRYNMEIGSTYSRLPEFYGREIKIEPINRSENFITKKDSGNNRRKTAEGTGNPKRRSKEKAEKDKERSGIDDEKLFQVLHHSNLEN